MTAKLRAPRSTALILLDHGSRRSQANSELEGLAARLAAVFANRYVCVEAAHMELAEPTLAQAFERCVANGAERIVVVLFFLAAGAHATDDIPKLAAEASALHGNVDYLLTPPLGTHETIADVVAAIVDETVSSALQKN